MITANIAIACFTKGFVLRSAFGGHMEQRFRFIVFGDDEAGIISKFCLAFWLFSLWLPGGNFQFCTQEIVIYIFSIYQKSKFFSLFKKFSFSSLQFNHIYFSLHLQINHIYSSVHLQTLFMKKIGLFIILKSC